MEEPRARKRPGPTPGPKTVKATILLEPDLLDWAKATDEGLSAMVRRLLKRERAKG